MPEIQVADCQTAADVMRLARISAERRRRWNARPAPAPAAPSIQVWSEPHEPSPLPFTETIKLMLEWQECRVVAQTHVPKNARGVGIILAAVARTYGLTAAELIADRRDKTACHARHVAFLLAKMLTGLSLPVIGRACGDRDHTTVLHAVHKLNWLRERLLERLTEGDHLEVWVAQVYALHPLSEWGKKYRPRIRSAEERGLKPPMLEAAE